MDSSTRSRSWSQTSEADLSLDDSEAALIAREAAAFAQALPEPSSRARYDRLADAASSGAIPGELVGALETMLELLFDAGRVSNRAALQGVFAKTPRGKEQSRALREVNAALETLRGQSIATMRVTSSAPSQHSLTVETDRCRLVVEFRREGATVTSLEVG